MAVVCQCRIPDIECCVVCHIRLLSEAFEQSACTLTAVMTDPDGVAILTQRASTAADGRLAVC